ncbi:hypothetical protein PINS_up005984 [Pythium insidiosum]|nr:hypothetical protein PINS_up005984 [Pythium insidiosum]
MTASTAKQQQHLRREPSASKGASTAAATPIPVVVKAAAAKPRNVVVHDLTEMKTKRQASTLIATEGRDRAIKECRDKVEKISRECRMRNVKYRDPHFDLSENPMNCLYGLRQMSAEDKEGVSAPQGVKRVGDIYDDPQFIVDGIDAGDIKQGAAGDCWFLAAVATIANMPQLLESICVARDEQVGVYGFIFFRDGEWVSEVVDDQLFIKNGDFESAPEETRSAFETEEQYIDAMQRGSKALAFAHCADSNETWLPLLEKAFAKIHGDYSAIEAGLTGEGVEDLTGGVTSEVICSDILDRDRFWKEELSQVNKEFLFAGAIFRPGVEDVKGILTGHAYSVLKAVEANGVRLVQVRNPWGRKEWTGAWSDGSPQWTAEWMTLLEHKFGDDGAFWMSYDDFLKTFTALDRTRVFTPEWTVAQCWTQEIVSWPSDKFSRQECLINLTRPSKVVIVLQQADKRYFVGLEGQYEFHLHFRLRKEGESDYYARSKRSIVMTRSVNLELHLTPGVWRVSYKITRSPTDRQARAAYINTFKEEQSHKFVAVARNFDYSLALPVVRGGVEPEEEVEEVEEVEEFDEEADGNQNEEEQEEEEETQEQQETQEGDAEEDEGGVDLDEIAVVGIRVHAKDPNLSVRLVGAEDGEDAEWELEPDDSMVKAFHASTGNQLALVTSLALQK